MENEWLKINRKKIANLQYRLTEISYKNEYQDIPIRDIDGTIKAAINEIKMLTNVIDKLMTEIEELKKKEDNDKIKVS